MTIQGKAPIVIASLALEKEEDKLSHVSPYPPVILNSRFIMNTVLFFLNMGVIFFNNDATKQRLFMTTHGMQMGHNRWGKRHTGSVKRYLHLKMKGQRERSEGDRHEMAGDPLIGSIHASWIFTVRRRRKEGNQDKTRQKEKERENNQIKAEELKVFMKGKERVHRRTRSMEGKSWERAEHRERKEETGKREGRWVLTRSWFFERSPPPQKTSTNSTCWLVR
jgi:hypothetical protein